MKGQWESNINVWFPFMFSQKWNCYFQNRIIMFCLPVPTLMQYICEIFIYFQDRSAYSAAGNYVDQSWDINRSQIHAFGNWDWGRAISRKLRHKWDFLCTRSVWSWKLFWKPPRTYTSGPIFSASKWGRNTELEFKKNVGARNWVGKGLSGGIDSLESNPGLHKRFKIRALKKSTTCHKEECRNRKSYMQLSEQLLELFSIFIKASKIFTFIFWTIGRQPKIWRPMGVL
jgi:hypothetical protein